MSLEIGTSPSPAWNVGSANYGPRTSPGPVAPAAPDLMSQDLWSVPSPYQFMGNPLVLSDTLLKPPSGQATTYLPPPSVSALVQPTLLSAPADTTQPLLQDAVGPKLGVTVGPDEVAERQAALTPAVGPDGVVAGGGTTTPAAAPADAVPSLGVNERLRRAQHALADLPGDVRIPLQTQIMSIKSQQMTYANTEAQYASAGVEVPVAVSVNAASALESSVSMVEAQIAKAGADLSNRLSLERSIFSKRGVNAGVLSDRLLNTGTLWATENAGKLSEAQITEASQLLNEMKAYEPQMEKALADGDLEAYDKLRAPYDTASQAFLELKTSIGGEPGKRRWNGYYTKSGDWVSDTSGVLVWAQILVPLVTTGLTLGMTMHENEKTRKWTEKQNEEEREHQMALTQLRGEQALALQGVANEGSGTASVGASSGVSSLGGSFHTA